jgi:hypothetical protein
VPKPSLRSVVSAAAVCASLVFASVAVASAQSTAAVGASGPDAATLRAIEGQVSTIRGLPALFEPDLHVLDHVALHQYLADEFERDYLPGEREADQKLWVTLGLIKPTDDYVQLQLDLLTDQVVGVYDPDSTSLLVVGDQGAFGPAEKITYAHEFNHALQDEYYDLNGIAPKHAQSNDRSLAVHGLIEGDAILLQTLWAQKNLSQDELIQLVRSAAGSDESLARAPAILRAELLFPYTEGFNFVRQAFRDANNTYGNIDVLFKNPPESTAQVLHPDKYRNRVHPLEIQLPDIAASLGGSSRRVGSGVLGELDTRVLLEQWGSDHADAVRIASGWTGDHWQLIDKDGRSAIVFKSTWESAAAASDFFSAYARGLRTRFDSATTDDSSRTHQALTTPVAATDLQLQGSDVLLVIAFDRDTANAIDSAFTSSAL